MLGPIIALAVAVAPAAAVKDASAHYALELKRQCPAKHLELLTGMVLQEELLAFRVSAKTRADMQAGWTKLCDPKSFGSSCGNNIALMAIDRSGGMETLVAGLCRDWRRCEEVAVCERAVKRRTR